MISDARDVDAPSPQVNCRDFAKRLLDGDIHTAGELRRRRWLGSTAWRPAARLLWRDAVIEGALRKAPGD